MVTFADLAKTKRATEAEGWEVFDSLPPVSVQELTGWRWKGYEIVSGHPLNGLLDKANWFGKEYFDEDNGNPLLTYNTADVSKRSGDDLWACHPPHFFHAVETGQEISSNTRKELEAKTTSCTLKTILFRGQVSASMFYDDVPTNDTFKRVDDNTVFGVMDYKFGKQPLFFVLEKYKPLKEIYPEYNGKYVSK